MKKNLVIFLSTLFILFGLFTYQFQVYSDGKLHIVFCDVGQGDAILIRTPEGFDILIDGGPNDSVLTCLSNNMPFWDRNIEAIILTHPHADHLTGLISVIERYTVNGFYTEKVESNTLVFKELKKILQNKKIKQTYLFSASKFTFSDSLELITIWPNRELINHAQNNDSEANLDVNGFSVVSLLKYKNFKALFTGDAGVSVMEEIIPFVGKVDVLKVPHHGSKTGLSQTFLSSINPKLSVISVGEKNKYGHPSASILKMLGDNNIKILRTDKDGEVEVVSDGKSWSVN